VTLRTSAVTRIAILTAIVAIAVFVAWRMGFLSDPARAKAHLQGMRQIRWLPVTFVSIYTVSAALGVPPVIATLVGGAVFGTKLGTAYSWIGAILGALGGYAIARWLGGNAIRHLLGRHRDKLDKLQDRATFASLFRLRVNPIVPYNILNFASGLSKVGFRDYFLATVFGVFPATAVYAYFADSVIAGATRARSRALWHIAIAGVIMILLSYGPVLWRRVRRN
jgi:uncharacterized membrane protein YdjX (TVP38/TMEM64 family)